MISSENIVKNKQLILLSHVPEGDLEAHHFKVLETDFDLNQHLEESELILKTIYVSIDPTWRVWISGKQTYMEPATVNAPMRSLVIGKAIKSHAEGHHAGEYFTAVHSAQEYLKVSFKANYLGPIPKAIISKSVPLSSFASVLGITGLTAYFGLMEIGLPKHGETILISGAAGATGSVAGGIAKILGLKVIGIAGTDEKCKWLTETLGFDGAINYKTTKNIDEDISRLCPEGIDIYFDNVGGKILNSVLTHIRIKARIVICGAISQYNSLNVFEGPANYFYVLYKRARIEGFVFLDYKDKFGEAFQKLLEWINTGKLHYKPDHKEHGLESYHIALKKLFHGENSGKIMLQLSEE